MLIYNHQKEFIGIDQADLTMLGLTTLEELKTENSDFADTFVKQPGYVHNFKHVDWIDFVECADSLESTKVIIAIRGKKFRSLLEVKTAFLSDEPSSKAYLVYLTNLREVQTDEYGNITDILAEKVKPTSSELPKHPEIELPTEEEEEKPKEEFHYDYGEIEDIPDHLDLEHKEELFKEETFADEPLEISEPAEEIEEKILIEEPTITPVVKPSVIPEEPKLQTCMEVFDNGYVYDPGIASRELGLPIDLIEEFIEDFVAQAKEFKDNIYEAFNDGDNEKVKTLSHKLKGVAANLRIEDALESLIVINTSSNQKDIKEELELFYKIISKLSGEKIAVTKSLDEIKKATQKTSESFHKEEIKTEPVKIEIEDDDDIFSVPLEKEKVTAQEKVDVKIDIPELADDNYFHDETLDTEDFNEDLFADAFETSKEESQPENSKVDDDILDLDIFEAKEASPKTTETKKENQAAYDVEQVAKEIGLSQEQFMEIFEDYLEEAKSLVTIINDAIKDNNPNLWRSKAVHLRGMSDNMRVNSFMKELETLISSQDATVAQEASISITEYLNTISSMKG